MSSLQEALVYKTYLQTISGVGEEEMATAKCGNQEVGVLLTWLNMLLFLRRNEKISCVLPCLQDALVLGFPLLIHASKKVPLSVTLIEVWA